MSMEFGKLNFAVGFNRTSAFPLDANSYFENYDSAVTAAAGAAEVGSSDSAYYVGQLIIVKDTTKGVGLYQIGADKTLVKFGQASSADELTTDLNTLKGRFNNIVRDLPITEGEDGTFTLLEPSESIPLGFFKNEEKTKLAGIEAGAQVQVPMTSEQLRLRLHPIRLHLMYSLTKRTKDLLSCVLTSVRETALTKCFGLLIRTSR